MWDLTLPGYKYLGPFNRLDKGEPTNKSDKAARKHDIEYGKYIRKGDNPYTSYNRADEDFLRNVQLNDYGGLLGSTFFRIKRGASHLGIVGRLDQPLSKRLRGSGSLPASKHEQKIVSLTNLPQRTTMSADGDGSGNAQGTKETPIDNPYVVFRGPPDYTFASLPFTQTRFDTGLDNVYARDHVFRLTSPYDCYQTTTATDSNVGAGTMYEYPEGADASLQKARWFDYYAGLYNYYHVISCQWNVFVENLGTEPIYVYQMFYNDDQPNGLATNEDMQLWPSTKYKYLDRRALAITAIGQVETAGEAPNAIMQEDVNSTALLDNFEATNMVSNDGVAKCVFSGEYHPGQFRREIHLDSSVENWTATTTNPALPEKLLIRVKPVNDTVRLNSATNAGDDITYKIQVKLNYLVEFKELPVGLRYPVQRQPLTVIIAAVTDSTN